MTTVIFPWIALAMTILSPSDVVYSEVPTSNRAVHIGNHVVALSDAKDRWVRNGAGRNYSFEFQRSCLCRDRESVHRVIVTDGNTSSVEVVSQYLRSETAPLNEYPTIFELYDEVGRLIFQLSDPDTILKVEYDELDGHPKSIYWNNQSERDGEWRVKITNVTAIQ